MTRRSWWLTAWWLVTVLAYAGLSRVWNDTESSWYRSLTEPWWQPPDLTFAIVWPVNYLALAVVGVLISRNRPDASSRMLAVFAVSVVFALGWAYLFGQQELLGGSAAALVIAAALTWLLNALGWRAGRWYGAGLVIYTVWMTLAASLSVGFVVLN